MSRHRNLALVFQVILSILLCGAVLLLTTKQWENPKLSRFTRSKEERNEIFLLVLTGVMAVLIEVIDIWFYLSLGLGCSWILHLGFVVWCVIVCRYSGYTYFCIVPALFEAITLTMGLIAGEAFDPSQMALMSVIISWLCLVWLSGYEKYLSE